MKGPNISYIDLLDDRLLTKTTAEETALQTNDKARLKHPLRPSSAGECERALAFKLMEYMGYAYYNKPPIEPRISRIFALGHAVEEMLLKLFDEVSYLKVGYKQQVLTFFNLTSEVEPALNTLVEGSNDGCFIGINGEFKCVFDVKSKATGIGKTKKTKWEEQDVIFTEMKSIERFSDTGWWVPDLPAFLDELEDDFFAMNFWQLNLYLNSQFMKERGFDHGSIIQFSKDDSKMREVRFNPSEDLYLEVERRFTRVIRAVEHKDPYKTKCEFLLGTQKCAFCPFNKQCWGEDQDALQSYFKTFPKKNWPVRADAALASKIIEYDKSIEDVKKRDKLKKEILQECLDRGYDKVQAGGAVYEIKKLKTTIDFRKGKA